MVVHLPAVVAVPAAVVQREGVAAGVGVRLAAFRGGVLDSKVES